MNLIATIDKYKSQVSWLILTFFASFLPAILRFITSNFCNINPFDIKDVLFAGIAFNLANFSIISVKDFPEKGQILLISLGQLLIITAILVLYLSEENDKNAAFHFTPFLFGMLFSVCSGVYCYLVNDLVVKTVI